MRKVIPFLLAATAVTAGDAMPAVSSTARSAARAGKVSEAVAPADNDPDRGRVQRLQDDLYGIVHGPVLGRLRVGVRVMDVGSGRLLFGQHGSTLMDPASNQKVLATATALLRLGSGWRFRTELSGPAPAADGAITGDLILRGSGDPSLRGASLEEMAANLAARGITRVTGGVLADPRRLGSDETDPGARAPLRINRAVIEVRVRPADEGEPALVTVRPSSEAFVIDNRARTGGKGRSRISVNLSGSGGRITIAVAGRIPARHGGATFRRIPRNQPVYAAILLRAALTQAGIAVQGPVGLYTPRVREPRRTAVAARTSDSPLALDPVARPTVLAVHESDTLPVLMRRINKDSDNEWAERLLETVGAEIYGGPATTAKGVRALREAITELGLAPHDYVPVNGSGLGHANRITPEAMADLLRTLFLDPRLGPDMIQSLSVGGVDGTTRNRFRGSPAFERVRAKTGTLAGKSCLSGYVGDGSDIVVFSIMVQGLRGRALASVRHAQVSAVNAMMRYARGAELGTPEESAPGTDFESGDEPGESDIDEGGEAPVASAPSLKAALGHEVQSALKQLGEKTLPLPALRPTSK
jgi:D-alanyl-D-alanine carboxypeptidase/D-alanyl-D-alanine-endopeptidase (penicillin-binding protein 4)